MTITRPSYIRYPIQCPACGKWLECEVNEKHSLGHFHCVYCHNPLYLQYVAKTDSIVVTNQPNKEQ